MLSRNYFAVIVVYNCSFQDSPIYESLRKQPEAQIIVCDNSTGDYGNRQFMAEIGHRYIDMKGNMGLPKAYNAAIDCINKENSVVCLFDDDTTVPEDYFKKLDMEVVYEKIESSGRANWINIIAKKYE